MSISIHLMFLLIRGARFLQAGSNRISIHLMFLLIAYRSGEFAENAHFNTSHVSINLAGLVFEKETLELFQYISCFY